MANTDVKYGSLASWADQLDSLNKEMRQKLEDIQKKINNLNGEAYESNSAVSIRGKITDMKPRFDQYKDVCDSYITFIKRAAEEWEATEVGRTQNADQFI